MPVTRLMRSPASDSRSGRISGMPPPTEASKRMSTPARSRGLEHLAPVRRHQLLVGGHDGLARGERVGDQRAGGLDAAHDLDHDVDVGVVHDRGRVGGEGGGRQRQPTVASEVAHDHLGHLDAHAGALLQHVGVVVDQLHECGTDVAAPQDPDPYPLVQRWSHRVSLPHGGRRPPHRGGRHGRPGRRRSRAAPPPEPGPRGRTRLRGAASGCRWKPSSGRRRR